MVLISNNHHGFKLPHGLVTPPVLCQRNGSLLQVSAALLEFFLEFFAERESVGDASGKADKDLPVEKPADFPRGRLEDGMFSHRNLAVSCDGCLSVAPYSADCGPPERTGHCSVPSCLLINLADDAQRPLGNSFISFLFPADGLFARDDGKRVNQPE